MARDRPTRRELLRLTAGLSVAGLAGCSEPITTPTPTTPTTTPTTPTKTGGDSSDAGGLEGTSIPLENVPIMLHRRAARHVQEANRSETAPKWQGAYLTGTVHAMYRPDVDGVAYYEFEVEPAGYVLVATDTHDMPIPHWDYQGEPISSQLAAGAGENEGASISRLYKMDALYYVGEDDAGERVAERGTRMIKVLGHTENHLETDRERSWLYGPTRAVQDDEMAHESEYELVEESGSGESPLEFEGWESWTAMKQGYEDSYGVLAEALRRDAEEEWEVLERIDEHGRWILEGQPREEVLLFEGAQFDLEGDGAEFVTADLLERGEGPPVLRLAVETVPSDRRVLDVVISYANGKRETLRFSIGDPSTPTNGSVAGSTAAGEEVFFSGGRTAQAGVDVTGAVTTSSHNWDYWWAGTGRDQRAYWQHEYEGCDVGCGPVAWGMLFGWADHQAWEGNSYWGPRWGLYRENADTYPAPDADAPRSHTSGPRRMIEEINEYVDTFCAFGSGATLPGHMHEAWKYFRGRTGTWLGTWQSPVGIPLPRFRRRAREAIIHDDTPAIIGTGWLHHYPLAYGYAHKVTEGPIFGIIERHHHAFYVNDGQGDPTAGWVNGRTWFAGRIWPHEP